MTTIFVRDPARSILATEFMNIKETSTVDIGDGKTKNITITELNTVISRIFIAGILSEVEDIGSDKSYLKAKILCKTGSFTLYAGDYQPEAAQFLTENMNNLPLFVAVVGKVNVYEPEQGKKIASIRPEIITLSDEETRNYWLGDAASYLEKRLADPSFPTEHREKYEKEVSEIRAFLKESSSSKTTVPVKETNPISGNQPSSIPLSEQNIGEPSSPTSSTPDPIHQALNQNPFPVSASQPMASGTPIPADIGSSIPSNSPSGLTEDENNTLDIIIKLSGDSRKVVSTEAVRKEMNIEKIKMETILKSLGLKGIINRKVPAFIELQKSFSTPAFA